MLFIKNLLLSLFLISFFLFNSDLVYAQGDEAASVIVYEKESLSKDILQLKLQYRSELEEYRRLENLYIIAKDQYHNLGTLASLEDAVQKTQEAMDSRSKVLRTYLRLLRLKLLSQPGIELPDKKDAEQSLLSALQKIEQHQQQLVEPLDKPKISEISDSFEDLAKQVEEAAYQTLAVMAIGELQTIHDKSIVLKDDMEVEIATAGGALKSTERKRSFDETDRVLNTLKPEFDAVEEKFSKPSTSGYKGVYRAIEDRLGLIHSALSQALTFLGELLKI